MARRFSDRSISNWLAPLLGEEVDDAVQRLVGTVGVQRGQAQVAGFCKGDGVFHGLAVADFAHQDHIGRLAQVFFRHAPAVGIRSRLRAG